MLPTSIQVWRKPPAFPAQWLYGLYDVVLVTGLIATIAVQALASSRLDASTGASDPNDFAVRNSSARLSLPRVHRSLPHVRDDGQRPFSTGQDGGSFNSDLPDETTRIFFIRGLDIISDNQNWFARRAILSQKSPLFHYCQRKRLIVAGLSFRGDAKHRTRNLEVPRCAIAHLRFALRAPRNDS